MANLRLFAALMPSAGTIIRHRPTTPYSYPHIYLQFNKNKAFINQWFIVFIGVFTKKQKSKLYFCFSVDNFLITYGRFVAKHNHPLHTDQRTESNAVDPSKQPLTQKK